MLVRERVPSCRVVIAASLLVALVGCEHEPNLAACTNSVDEIPVLEERTLAVGQLFTPRYRNYPCGTAQWNLFAARHSSLEGPLEFVLRADSGLHVRPNAIGVGRIRVLDPDGIAVLADIRVTIVE